MKIIKEIHEIMLRIFNSEKKKKKERKNYREIKK